MNYKLPSLLYSIRLILFVSLLSSLLWMSSLISTVLYLVAASFYICDFVISNKYIKPRIGNVNKILLLILDRMIVLMPLFFACLYVSFAVWVFIILVILEVVINMYKLLRSNNVVSKKISNILLFIYNIAIYCAGILFMFTKVSLASYFVLAIVVMGAVCVIYLSITIVSEGEEANGGNESQENGSNDVVIDHSSMSDEIVE